MNISGYIVSLIVSFALGYFAYDVVFPKTQPKVKTFVESVTVRGPSGNVTLEIDVRDIKPNEVPAEVKMKKAAPLKAIDGNMSIILEKGATATVENYSKGMLKIKDPKGKFVGMVPWEKTNFTSGVALNRIKELMGDPEAEKRAAALAQQKEIERKARELAAQQSSEEEPEEEEMEEEEPEEEMTKGSGPLTTTVSEDEIISLMKASVKAKTVSEFTEEGVTTWEAGENETIADAEYQIGFATYEKETIFGKQPVVGKCLIRDGAVKKWVYAKTGADIP